jgi:hypothetical protein
MYGENFGCVLMNMRICCCDLVGMDSKTLVPYLWLFLFYLVYVFFFIRNQIFFGTSLGFN